MSRKYSKECWSTAIEPTRFTKHGDALFPALALAPKAAILATLYSAIPAVVIGYSWMLFFEL